MKNAYVLEDHHGDDGTVTAGMILVDMTNKRFEALAKNGLVREATATEIKEGYKPPFEKDDSEDDDDDGDATSFSDLFGADTRAEIEKLKVDHAAELEKLGIDHAADLKKLSEDHLAEIQKVTDEANARIEEVNVKHESELKQRDEALAAAAEESKGLRAELEAAKSEKQAKTPANKKAEEPANKAG